MIGQTYSYGTKAAMHHRKILQERTEDGRRVYILRNLDDPESKQIPAIADDVDKKFFPQKGKIRADKYSDSPFQKRRKKAGGF